MSEKTTRDKENTAYYELDELKSIPIVDVATALGLEVTTKGGGKWCKVRDERTASCKLYEHTNSYSDFGIGRAGDTIDFVAYVKEVSNVVAIGELARMFHIQPINHVIQSEQCELSYAQYEKIGISGELATENFDFDLNKYGVEKTQAFSDKYRMTVNELKKQYPKVYENMIKARAIPYLYNQRQQYYRLLWTTDRLHRECGGDLAQMPPVVGEFFEKARQLNSADKIMQQAVRNTNIRYTPVTLDVRKDITAIREGTLSFEVGTQNYYDLKKGETARGHKLCFKEVSASDYEEGKEVLSGIKYAAFVKGDKVNLAYRLSDTDKINEVFPKRRQQGASQYKPKAR